jgi:hypothetical protein
VSAVHRFALHRARNDTNTKREVIKWLRWEFFAG